MSNLHQNVEALKRAQMYIEKLSNGYNPITGDYLPDDTVLRNERLSRCFSYVAEVLKLVIDFGGVAAISAAAQGSTPTVEQKIVLQPFGISLAQRRSVYLTDKPSDISTFTKNINNVIDANSMQKLKGVAFATWLFRMGFIEKDGNSRKPTPAGLSLGISTQIRQTNQLIYSREAQQFLLDNIDEIIAISNGN